jgi:CheY-like chemotaxis protein
LRGLGAWRVEPVETSRRGYERAESWAPNLIVTEFSAQGVDAVAFTRAIRRSGLACRRCPIVVASSQTKASEITAARDAGAKRRDADRQAERLQSDSERFLQAVAILSSAISRYETDPGQAGRAMQAQIETLSALALKLGHPRLVHAVAALDRYLASANHSGSRRLIQSLLEDGANPLTDVVDAGAELKLDRAA